jgi:hypothetical protein
MQAAVHERVGWSHLRVGSASPARRAFIEAVQAYDRAEDLLLTPDDRVAADAYEETRGLISVRRTKPSLPVLHLTRRRKPGRCSVARRAAPG